MGRLRAAFLSVVTGSMEIVVGEVAPKKNGAMLRYVQGAGKGGKRGGRGVAMEGGEREGRQRDGGTEEGRKGGREGGREGGKVQVCTEVMGIRTCRSDRKGGGSQFAPPKEVRMILKNLKRKNHGDSLRLSHSLRPGRGGEGKGRPSQDSLSPRASRPRSSLLGDLPPHFFGGKREEWKNMGIIVNASA